MLHVSYLRPTDYTEGRTQADRLIVRLELVSESSGTSSSSSSSEESQQATVLTDAHLFVVHDDHKVFTQFDRVDQPYDLAHLGLTGSPRRTDQIDCVVPSRDLAEQMFEAILSDLSDLTGRFLGFSGRIRLDGSVP